MDYLAARTDGFTNVTNVWLGGNSRGGAIAMRLAKIIQRRIINGEIDPPDNMQIIVTGADAVSLPGRDDLSYKERVYICDPERWFCSDANGHDLASAFPYNSDPSLDHTRNLHIRQTCGKSTGMDTMVHGWTRGDWSNFVYTDGLPGGFYTQDMQGFDRFISHLDMCRVWMQVNAISNVQFFFSKALDDYGNPWDTDFVPYPDGCP